MSAAGGASQQPEARMARGVEGFSGANLRRSRLSRKLSADDFAADLGVSETTVRRWETGVMPTASNLRAIASYLGVTVADLLSNRIASDPTLADLRHLAALTFDEAQKASGVSRSSIERLERGATHYMNPQHRRGLAAAYGVQESMIEAAAAASMALRVARSEARKAHKPSR